MKNICLLGVPLLLCTSLSAQNPLPDSMPHPQVHILSAHKYSDAQLDRAARRAEKDFHETHRHGFQQSHSPHHLFTSSDNRFSFALGGFVEMRAAYDFEGISDNLDFLPYDIAVPGNYNSSQKLQFDATTTRLYMKAISNSGIFGRVTAYIETDFRGGKPGSYTPELRSAYLNLCGVTLGRDVTTFCDLSAAPETIDVQGPNAYNFRFTTLIRYEGTVCDRHLRYGIALEMPRLTATYNDHFKPLHQRMPDIPFYLQYAWGAQRDSHIRLSSVLRNMYYHNDATGNNSSLLGWGVQLSGRIKPCKFLSLHTNATYGEGIATYIQDLAGSGLDFVPDPQDVRRLQTLPMWGWQLAGEFHLTARLTASTGYSTVQVNRLHGAVSPSEYHRGQYAFCNVFFAITHHCKVAGEYLYGTRKNMDETKNHTNRINLMLQYTF